MMNKEVDLSIVMMVYNHADYVEKALNSIFMQKTNYTYEVIIGEDCSPDNSRNIINKCILGKEDKVILQYNEHNIGANANEYQLLRKCNGKYIAFLEGDDFWIDERKIQKQIDFLESHTEYIGTCHNVKIVNKDGLDAEEYRKKLYTIRETGKFDINDFKKGEWPNQTASFIFRNFFKNYSTIEWKYYEECIANGDAKMILLQLLINPIYMFSEFMSAYRYVENEGSSWNASVQNKNMNLFYYKSVCSLEQLAINMRASDIKLDVDKYKIILAALSMWRHTNSISDFKIAMILLRKGMFDLKFYLYAVNRLKNLRLFLK